jgi:hypothetical protein
MLDVWCNTYNVQALKVSYLTAVLPSIPPPLHPSTVAIAS